MGETRKLAAILASDVVGYSRLAGADEERILARLRTLRSDLIDPIISVHHGRIVKRTGDGSIIEFRSVVDAVRCAIEVQNGMAARNAGVPADERIEYRVGVHLGDVVEEADGDLMGDGVNIARPVLQHSAIGSNRRSSLLPACGEKVRMRGREVGRRRRIDSPLTPALSPHSPSRDGRLTTPYAGRGDATIPAERGMLLACSIGARRGGFA